MMPLPWIREHYNVPAFRGIQVTYKGQAAVIIGGRGGHLALRVDGRKRPVVTHPTTVDYPALPVPARARGWCRFCRRERSLAQGGKVVGRHQRRGADRFPVADRLCPGAGDTPRAICSWTIPAPTPTTEQAPATPAAELAGAAA